MLYSCYKECDFMTECSATQNKILEIGKKEFLAKGFRGASLRGVVKEAGYQKFTILPASNAIFRKIAYFRGFPVTVKPSKMLVGDISPNP
jgi:hypothetical protein